MSGVGASFDEIEGLNEPRANVGMQRQAPLLSEVKVRAANMFWIEIKSAASVLRAEDGSVSQVAFGKYGSFLAPKTPDRWLGVVEGSTDTSILEQATRCGFKVREFSSAESLLATAFEHMKEIDYGRVGNGWMVTADRATGTEKQFWLEYLQCRVEDNRSAYHRDVDVLTIIQPVPFKSPDFELELKAPFQTLNRMEQFEALSALPDNLKSVALPLAYIQARSDAIPRRTSSGLYGC